MLDARIYHKAGRDSLPSILAAGLRYGRQGRHSEEERVGRANDFLNELCPGELRRTGVDRNACTFCYLAVDGRLVDVESGAFVPVEDWQVEDGFAKLRVTVPPGTAHVSDLEVYDELAERIDEAPQCTLDKLGERYWQRLVPLPDVCAHYRVEGHALVRAEVAPPTLPARLERVEVLVTVDVPPDALELLA